MRDQHNPLSRHTQNLFCDGRLPLIEGAGGEPAAEEPEQNGTGFDFDSASITEIMQVASTLDLPHSSGNERVDSESGVL
jgi:hypothetical protein